MNEQTSTYQRQRERELIIFPPGAKNEMNGKAASKLTVTISCMLSLCLDEFTSVVIQLNDSFKVFLLVIPQHGGMKGLLKNLAPKRIITCDSLAEISAPYFSILGTSWRSHV